MTTRTRSRGSLTAASTYQEWAWRLTCADTSWHTNGPLTTNFSGTVATMVDTVTPGFHKRKARGEVIFNDMFFLERTYQPNGGQGGYVVTKSNSCNNPAFKAEYDCRGDWTPYFLPKYTDDDVSVPSYEGHFTGSDESRFVNEVVTRMLSQRGRASNNLFETLAELEQVRKLLDLRANYVLRLLNAVGHKRSKLKGLPASLLREGTSFYLLWRYGLRPIAADIVAILSGLEKKVGTRRITTRDEGQVTGQNSKSYTGTYGILTSTVQQNNIHRMKVRATSLDTADITLLNNIGFTGKGLLTLPWELVTASFVADWFANIGDFLGAITPAFGWNNLGACVTIEHSVISSYSVGGTVNNNTASYIMTRGFSGSYDVIVRGKRRVPCPSPSLAIKNNFGFDGFTRSADAFALVAQKILNLKIEPK